MQSPLKSSIEPEFIHQEILLTEGVKIFFPTSCDETRNTVEDKYQFAGFYGFTLVKRISFSYSHSYYCSKFGFRLNYFRLSSWNLYPVIYIGEVTIGLKKHSQLSRKSLTMN